MHEHLFQYEGTTWTCCGHEHACGYRAPACFTPVESALTAKGLVDFIINENLRGNPWDTVVPEDDDEDDYPEDDGYYFSGTGEWSEDSSYEDYLNRD